MKAKKAKVEKAEEVVAEKVVCGDCAGSGLKDSNNLCAPCEGHGKV